MFHLMASPWHRRTGEASYETDRATSSSGAAGHSIDPAAMHVADLSNSEGAVLDPIVSVRRMVTLEPDQSVQLDIVTGVTETRDQALALIEKYHDHRLADRVFELAWTHKQVVLRQLQADRGGCTTLWPTGRIHSVRQPAACVPRRGHRPQQPRASPDLWGYGISGDLPIVLLRISEKTGLGLVQPDGPGPRLLADSAAWPWIW